MTALVRMRLAGFVRSGRAFAPAILALVVLGVIHGGGAAPAASAYGYSAVTLFPVLAWQTKLALDAEPDIQRRLARLAVGAGREAAAGLLAAAVVGAVVCLVAMLAPWPFGAICRPGVSLGCPATPLTTGIALGVLAHVLSLAAALALGALASRVVTRTVRNGLMVLVSGAVLAIVFGLKGSIAPWLVPPVMAAARALTVEPLPSAGTFALITAWAALWCAVVLGGYLWLRRRRS